MKKKNNVNSKNKLNDKDTFQMYYAAILLWIDTEKLAMVHIWPKMYKLTQLNRLSYWGLSLHVIEIH